MKMYLSLSLAQTDTHVFRGFILVDIIDVKTFT